jgi:hypothetical protein
MWPHAGAGGVARTLPASPLLPLLLLSVAGAAHDPFFCLMPPSSSLFFFCGQFMVRILFVTSGSPNLQTARPEAEPPAAKRSRK